MNNELKNLQPQILWKHFARLCAIPRPSKQEGKAVEFVKAFAVAQGLDYTVDAVGNVVIRKPATKGYENRPGVVLQSHLDMVPQKNGDVRHNFETDPIDAYVDGDWVKARGTTLGADNGIGVAAALAVLESEDVQHGPVEALFTIDEETGMTGANGLQAGVLKGSIFINLDSEEEGELCIGCAGGLNAKASIVYTEESVSKDTAAFKISLTGLKGGHSGADIHLGRGNANQLMVRFLWNAARKYNLRLASIEGGNLRNAIPREASAVVVVSASQTDKLKEDVTAFLHTVSTEFTGVESGIVFSAEPVALPAKVMTKPSLDNVLNTLYAMPNGAMRMIADMPEVVETSTNLAIVESDGKQVNVACLLRSAVDSAKNDLADKIMALFALSGNSAEMSEGYPGWKPNFDSNILKTMTAVYRKLYRKDPAVKVIHAGLECAIFGASYPDMDYISFGPTILHPHSPGEKVNIPSVAAFWDYLIETLKTVGC
ncbi:MAG: aminoacyl-histidine dipeptidase [Bacteroidales bacterium]|jgi:dipeptidase D|nr:aminoacyl-histidine dipeptidase [Bacteroidales bacterium]